MGYQAALDHYITALPASPFVDVEQLVDEYRFHLHEKQFFDAIKSPSDRWPMLDWPTWANDDPPLFIGAPSDDFIAACHRDLLPLLEQAARRG